MNVFERRKKTKQMCLIRKKCRTMLLSKGYIIALSTKRLYQQLRSVADNYEKVIARQLTMLRIFGTQSVFLLIGLFALIIFTASLYCENYKRKIAACMIEGNS